MKNALILTALLFSLLLIFACGGRESLTPTSLSSIDLAPSTATMLAYSAGQFIATGYDDDGDEIYFIPASWAIYPPEFGVIEDQGLNDDDEPYAVLKPTGVGTAELHCVFNAVRGVALLSASATLESITISPEATRMLVGNTTRFVATAKDVLGNVLTTFSPTWELRGGIGIITVLEHNRKYVDVEVTTYGVGTLEAFLQGLVGTAEITATTESS